MIKQYESEELKVTLMVEIDKKKILCQQTRLVGSSGMDIPWALTGRRPIKSR